MIASLVADTWTAPGRQVAWWQVNVLSVAEKM